MGKRAFWLLAGFLAVGAAHASEERFSLQYPGWSLYLDLRAPSYEARVPGEPSFTRSLSLRLPGRSLFSDSGLRFPLQESSFLSLEATVHEWYADPAIPSTGRRAFQAGIGVGVEF
jgi:hypothetical protein